GAGDYFYDTDAEVLRVVLLNCCIVVLLAGNYRQRVLVPLRERTENSEKAFEKIDEKIAGLNVL
ncbi:MAG: hypothetical protein KDD28_27870, partial [Phaeodactylibacter sp.]|nr:hypothetical protein [Phaeodactylibacter sp.]